jgi:hypothetical protein
MIHLDLFYYFMIIFQYSNIVILSLIIFYNQYVNLHRYRYFKILRYHIELLTSFIT